jgi:hypothetical protein
MQLERPSAAPVAFDYKTGRTAIGCPLEHIKSGSLRGLVEYGAFYAARLRRPELAGANPNRLGLDDEFVSIFWTMLTSFTKPEALGREIAALVESAAGSPLGVLQLAEFMIAGLEPAHKQIYRLPVHEQEQLLAIGSRVLSAFHAALAGWDAGSVPAHVLPLVEECLARLQHCITTGAALSRGIKSSLALSGLGGDSVVSEGERCGGSAHRSHAVAALPRLPPTLVPRPRLLPTDLTSAYQSLWHAPYGELAAQWAYCDHGMFRAIPLAEWLACGWDNPRYLHAADAIRRYIDRFNATALWVTCEVLAEETPEGRAAVIVRFVKVGLLLRAFNDFTALAELSMGLRRTSVQRLARSWELVPDAAMGHWQALVGAVEDKRNYRTYKEAIKALPRGVPAVPHLGPHTAEMTMQEQLLAAELPAPDGVSKWVHFRRLRELHKLTAPLLEMQDCGYEAVHDALALVAAADTDPAAADPGDAAASTTASAGAGRTAAAAAAGEAEVECARRLLEAVRSSSAALLRMPPHQPALSNMLDAAVRPFVFACEEERNAAVARLEARSRALEPDPAAEAEAAAAASGAGGRGEDDGEGGAGEDRPGQRGRGLLSSARAAGRTMKRFFSPSRRAREPEEHPDEGNGGGGSYEDDSERR